MKSIPFTECVDLVGSRCKPFNGTKKYVSTGAVDVDQINEAGIEIIDYEKRPSRANLEASLGDVLFAKMQGTKKTLLINSSLVENIYSTGFCAVKAKKNVLTERCLYHLLTSKMFLEQKDKNCSGATQKAITNKGLQKVILHVPDINKQDLIATQLDLIVKIITLRKQELVELDDLIKARFVEMFGDPVSNSKGLQEATLPEIGIFGRGVSKHRPRNDPKLLGGKYPLIQTGDVAAADLYILSYTSTYSDIGLAQSKIWNKGTLCITIAANIAKTAILDFDACFPDSVVGFMANDKTNNVYIHYWFSFFQRILEEQAPESAQKNINLKVLSELKVICPEKEEQDKFADFVAQIDKSKLLSGCRLFHSWAPENRDKPKHVGVPQRKTKVLRGGRRQQ